MAHRNPDRCRFYSSTTGTGTYSVGGTYPGSWQGPVAAVGDGNTADFCAVMGNDWEVFTGTVTDDSPDTVSRDTILASSNSGSAVDWGPGVKDIFVVESRSPRKLGTIVASNVATVDFTGLTSAYKFYRLEVLSAVPATDAVTPYLRLSVSATFQTGASAYHWTNHIHSLADAVGRSTGDSKIDLVNTTTVGSDTGECFNGTIWLPNPSQTSLYHGVRWKAGYTSDAATPVGASGHGSLLSTSAVDGIRFYFSSGNVESGTFILYGWN